MEFKKYFWGILIVLAVGLAVWYFKTIFFYIIIAGILALIGQPIDRFYTKYLRFGKLKLSLTLSAGLAFLTLLLVFFFLSIFFIPLITEEAKILSSLDKTTILSSLQKPIDEIEGTLRKFNIDFDGMALETQMKDKLMSVLTVTNLSVFFNQFIGVLGDLFIAFFAISFLTFFFLRDEDLIIASLFSFVPEKYSEKAKNVWNDSQRLLKRYFIGVLLEVLIVIICLSIGLWIAGIRHAMLIALFAGLMNVIPYIGPLLGTLFALFIGVTTNSEMGLFLLTGKTLAVFIATNLADAFFLQPLIYSSSVKAHPLEIFLVILVGASIGGVGGMILAVPSYTIIRVIVKEFFTSFRLDIDK